MEEKNVKPKKSWKRILLKSVLIAVIALAVLLTAAILFLNFGAAATVRTVGSKLTGVPVELSNVVVNPFTGVVKFNGFRVGNPEGFQNDSAVKVGKFHFDLGMKSLGSDTIEIEHLELGDVALDYEYQIGGSNLDVIKNNVESFTGKPSEKSETAEEPAAEQPGDGAPQKKVVIRKLILSNIQVTVSSRLTRTSMPLFLPPIEMENVGEEGENLAEVIDDVLTRVMTGITQAVDVSKLGGSLQDAGKVVGSSLQDAGSAVGGSLQDAGSAVGGSLQDAGKTVGDSVSGAVQGLFGGDKSKK